MVNFDALVDKILINEAAIVGVPQWFQKVIDKHKEIFGIDITDEDVFDFFELLDDAKISEAEGLKNYNKIKILDFMKVFYDTMNPKPKDVNEFKTFLTNNTNFVNLPIVKRILSLNSITKNQWELNNKNIIDLKNRSEKLAGQRGADALQSEYGDDFIIPAVQKIIKKRIDFFTRIAKLKSPTTPFVNLISDVFKNPEQYESGAKKITSDFEAVDKFYIDNLIEIAKAAKQFYAAELTNLKLAPTQLENFILWVDDILNEASIPSSYEAALARSSKTPVQPSQPTTPSRPATVVDKNQIIKNIAANKKAIQSSNFGNKQVSPQVIKDTKQKELQDTNNRILYLSGKPIKYKKFKIINPNKIQETDKEITVTPLTVSQILQLKTPESNALSQALSKVAEYSKSRTGAGERFQQLGQLGSNIAAAGGAKLYG
jgi:hypothetical protein